MKASYIVIHKCGKTCQNETEPEVNKIKPLLQPQFSSTKVKKPDEKPEEIKFSGKIRPLLNIQTKF
jgi:hypothetical protein